MSKRKSEHDVIIQLIRRAMKDIERATNQLDNEEIEKIVKLRGVVTLLKKMENSLK